MQIIKRQTLVSKLIVNLKLDGKRRKEFEIKSKEPDDCLDLFDFFFFFWVGGLRKSTKVSILLKSKAFTFKSIHFVICSVYCCTTVQSSLQYISLQPCPYVYKVKDRIKECFRMNRLSYICMFSI